MGIYGSFRDPCTQDLLSRGSVLCSHFHMTCIHRFESFPLRAVPRSRRIDAALCSVLLHSVVVAGAVAGHSTIQGHENTLVNRTLHLLPRSCDYPSVFRLRNAYRSPKTLVRSESLKVCRGPREYCVVDCVLSSRRFFALDFVLIN